MIKDHGLQMLFNRFMAAMHGRLCEASARGWSGWDNHALAGEMRVRVMKNIREGNAPDAANLLMMLWNMREPLIGETEHGSRTQDQHVGDAGQC